MRQILALIIIFLLVSLVGCNKEENKKQEITAEVVKEPEHEKAAEAREEITTTVKICYDTDNGIIRWEKGTVMGFYENTTRFELEDNCYNKNYVVEYYCENEEPLETIFLCKNGCIDSHCA